MNRLGALEAYRAWAPDYDAETAVSQLEDQVVGAMAPAPAGKRLLDAGCGTGRRMRNSGAAHAVGVDQCAEMLAVGVGLCGDIETWVGDLRALPVSDSAFDIVWCRLAVGHVPDCAPVYAELARAAAPGGHVVVSDFHPDAWRAGHRRTFRKDGELIEVEHFVHEQSDHLTAARRAGLALVDARRGEVGPAIRDCYARTDRLDLYMAQLGLPLVLALVFRKPPG